MIYILFYPSGLGKTQKLFFNNFFLNGEKILAFWCFANNSGIVWGTFSKKNDFLVKTHRLIKMKTWIEIFRNIFEIIKKYFVIKNISESLRKIFWWNIV